MYLYMYVTKLMKKEAMNLRESKGRSMVGFGGRKRKERIV